MIINKSCSEDTKSNFLCGETYSTFGTSASIQFQGSNLHILKAINYTASVLLHQDFAIPFPKNHYESDLFTASTLIVLIYMCRNSVGSSFSWFTSACHEFGRAKFSAYLVFPVCSQKSIQRLFNLLLSLYLTLKIKVLIFELVFLRKRINLFGYNRFCAPDKTLRDSLSEL